MGDGPVAETGQMPHGGLDASPVVAADRGQGGAARLAVDQDDGLGPDASPPIVVPSRVAEATM